MMAKIRGRGPLRRGALIVFGAALVALAGAAAPSRADPIKIGVVKLAASGPIFVAQERGYFAAEGVPAELSYFQAGEPVAVATVSHSIDFGVVGTSGGLYSLGLQGALRIIAGGYREAPGWQLFALCASNRAYAGGLKTYADLPGHSVAVTTHGSPTHYAVGLIEQKFHLDPASVRIAFMQSIPNILSAVSGGQADAGILNSTGAIANLARGTVKLIGWTGDETPWQLAAAFTSARIADTKPDTVERFLRAYRRGSRDYHDAFTGPDGRRKDGPEAPAILAIIAKYLDQPVDQVSRSISYVDAEQRLDVQDILHQIAWYKSEGMVKGPGDGSAMIDKRYVIPFPEHGAEAK